MRKLLFGMAFFLTCSTSFAGAWGPGSFDNDDSMDWVAQCTESKGVAIIASALQAVLKPGQIDASDGSAAVAAAEVIAAAKGRPSKSLPPELSVWLNGKFKGDIAKLAPVARKALMRLKEPQASELKQLWSESPKADKQWTEAIAELEVRLR